MVGKIESHNDTYGKITDLINRAEEINTILEQLPKDYPRIMTWIPDNRYAYETRFICSNCGKSECVPTIGFLKCIPIWDFCPNCGAIKIRRKDEQDKDN